MLNYCIVKQKIGAITEDTLDDDDRYPDYTSVFGQVVFASTMANGSAYKITDDAGVVHTVPATRITAQIINGEIVHEGLPGLPLFAAGPNANPSTIVYTATYSNLTAAGLPISLNSITFRAVPGETIDLSSYTPVAGAPTPGIIQGPAGHTPIIGDNGNWWIGGKDTGVAATSPLVHRYTELREAFEENTLQIKALAAMNGVSPESPVDGQTAILIDQPDTLTHAALASNFAEVGVDGKLRGGIMPTLSLAASPAMGASVTPAGTTPKIVGRIGDDLVGFDGGRIYLSPDEYDWRDVAPTPQGARVQIILPCEDGEVLCAIYSRIYRSVGWGTGSVTWQHKHESHGSSYFEPYCVNGRSGKFIASDYGDRTDSRYVHISIDDGETWTQVWDSDADADASTPDFSHVHGVEYDHYRDRFYISEGHGPAAGLYVSVDDGATWMKPPGLFMDPAPTTVNVTPDGLVCGSDSARAGLLGVVAQDNPMDEKFIETWRWHKGLDGVLGFGVSGHTDPDTGIVYVAYRTGREGTNPIIAGGTPTAGGLVWEYDGTDAVILNDVKHAVVKDGRLYAWGTIAGQDVQIRGHIPPPGVPLPDTATTRMEGTSVMVGHGATGDGIRATAVGVNARATGNQDSTAIGYDAESDSNSLAVGMSAIATSSSTAIGNQAATSSGGRQTALGAKAVTKGGNGTALGADASAAALSTAVGTDATTLAYGVAVGRLSNAAASGTAVGDSSTAGGSGLALGANASAGPSSVALGAEATTASGGRELAIGRQATTTAGDSTAIGGAAQAAIYSVAVGTHAQAAAGGTAIGRQAIALHSRSVAIGRDVTATAEDQVAFGPRHVELDAIASAPSAPDAGKYRMWSEVDGTTGKMRLMVQFPTGTPIVIAQEDVDE